MTLLNKIPQKHVQVQRPECIWFKQDNYCDRAFSAQLTNLLIATDLCFINNFEMVSVA